MRIGGKERMRKGLEGQGRGRKGVEAMEKGGEAGKEWEGMGQVANPMFWQIQCLGTCLVPEVLKDRTSILFVFRIFQEKVLPHLLPT